MLPSETMIWQPEFTDKTLSRKPGAVHYDNEKLWEIFPTVSFASKWITASFSV
ncbi:hypothetical protein ECP03022938_5253 [Escherichia coli P0302293.8]|nr:hypothetical protein EC2016001_5068 [Escherichia coli 201600.1]ENE46742.1 hypothetical protein ECP03022938_5253 [Escherichia coli P0302293.8]ENH11864.1 hypothetical protein ECP030230814_5365 [Escherichia coli P0302308.14]